MPDYRDTRKSAPEEGSAVSEVHSGELTGPGDEGEARVSQTETTLVGALPIFHSPPELRQHPSG